MIKQLVIVLGVLFVGFSLVYGHGSLLDPVQRGSRWRYNNSAPRNYDDHGLFCGGYGTQWGPNRGNCGLCGDNYALPRPRPNELGGRFGDGTIVKAYTNTNTIRVRVDVTVNHLGYFIFHLCNLDVFGVESPECFNKLPLELATGGEKLSIGKATGNVYATLKLPAGLSSRHAVLRWTYVAGNNWGQCPEGGGRLGCGPQENFVNCADISIKQ